MDNYFVNRKTIRSFSDEKVGDELVHSLLGIVSHAPTTGNMQLYSVVATRDEEKKKKLAECHFNQPASVSAPLILTFCADFNRFDKWCNSRNAIPGFRNFQSFMSAVIDTVCVAQQFNTVAEMYGLGCCYLGTVTYNAPQISSLLKLPEMVVPVVSLAVGFPLDAESQPSSDRLPVGHLLHIEEYVDYTSEDIDNCYAYKESLPESAKFISENNKETLAQVFTDVRYPESNNTIFSDIYYRFIEEKGFQFPK